MAIPQTPKATIGVLVQPAENENAYDLRDLEFLSSVMIYCSLLNAAAPRRPPQK
jgi:hypothetical protein